MIRTEILLITLSALAASVYSGPHMALGWLVAHLVFLISFVVVYFKCFYPERDAHSRVKKWLNAENLDTRYLDYRAFAEGLRVQIFWSLQGLESCASDYYASRHHKETQWISSAIRNSTLKDFLEKSSSSGYPESKMKSSDIVGVKWIQDQRKYYLGEDIGEFKGRYMSHKKRHHNLECLSIGFLGIAILLTILNLSMHLAGYRRFLDAVPNDLPLNEFITWLNLMVASCFIFAGAIKAYDSLMGNEERSNSYMFYGLLFKSAEDKFRFSNDKYFSEEENDALVYDLGKAAVEESGDWLIKHRKQSLNIKDQF